MTSAVTHFADTQARNGRVFDYFTVQPEKVPCERENWCKYVRVPVEADVEYRFVNAAFIAWQATGDDAWIRSILPNLERALEYAFTHPWRWDPELELVKRPYTIDSWDFAYTAGSHDWLQFQIDDNTFWESSTATTVDTIKRAAVWPQSTAALVHPTELAIGSVLPRD